MRITYYKPTIAFFVGRCANLKLCARKLPLCEPEHLCLETHKKATYAYCFSLATISPTWRKTREKVFIT